MQAHGSDRVRKGRGEQWILLCPRPKGWVARTAKTLTTAERPGSAVLWDDQYFEVVAETASGSAVRYVLEPWRDEHVMRTVDAYDAASEQRRDEQHRAAMARTRGRGIANLFGLFIGHLPARVQESLGSELGILPARLTALSLVIPVIIVGVIVNVQAQRYIDQRGALPVWLLLFAAYLGLESAIRLNIVWTQSRPIGSAAGFVVYTLFYLIAPNRRALPSPLDPATPRVKLNVAPDIARHDAYVIREPLLTLLTPAEQRIAAERFGYDYRRTAPLLAVVILVVSVLGVVSSWLSIREGAGPSAFASLLAAGLLAFEQIIRLHAFRRGPAGSVLALFVRPFARKVIV